MRNCVNCRASIASDVNFCPRCGAAQSTGPSDTEADTLKLETQAAPAADTVRMTPPTTPITTVIRSRSRGWKNIFVGLGVFAASILIGAGIMLGLRSHNTNNQQVAVKAPAQEAPSTSQSAKNEDASKPTVIIENPDAEKSESQSAEPAEDPAKKADEIAKKQQEIEKKKLELAQKDLDRKEKELAEKESRLKEPQSPPPAALPAPPNPLKAPNSGFEDIPGADENDNPNAVDRGRIAVRFKVAGDALVKVHGGEISVIPVSGATVGPVTRLVGRPLPNERCRVTIKQKPYSGAIAALIEQPNLRNNFTVTVKVSSVSQVRDDIASFLIVWRLPQDREP